MGGVDETSGSLFCYVANDALASLDADFEMLYTDFGRPSIPLERLIHSVCQIGLAPRAFKQRLNAAILDRRFVAIKRIARHTHDLASFADITQLLGQVQQSSFVFDDLVSSIQHCGFLN